MNKLLITITLLFAVGCSNTDPVSTENQIDNLNLSKPIVETEYDRDISSLVTTSEATFEYEFNTFTNNLYSEVLKTKGEENFMISPYSVSVALAMTINGSNGATTDSMLNTLGFTEHTVADLNGYLSLITDDITTNIEEVKVANSIWCSEAFTPLKRSFYEIVTEYYLADIYKLETAEKVNKWVSAKTNDKIPKILDDASGSLILINAIYFKGLWQLPFEKDATSKKEFISALGTTTVDMMAMSEDLLYKKGKGYSAVSLPYEGERLSMMLYLPDDSITLSQLWTKLRMGDEMIGSLDTGGEATSYSYYESIYENFSQKKVNLSMPKFKTKTSLKLDDMLKSMGMGIAFDQRSDFTNFATGENLSITTVYHKTFIDVYEEGTEAAAVTAVLMGNALIDDEIDVTYNRPFLYVIRDEETKTNLFMGQVVNPN